MLRRSVKTPARWGSSPVAGASELGQIGNRRVFPSNESLGLAAFDEALPEHGSDPFEVLALLDEKGSPATVATNDPRYFGFVIGAALPAAAAAGRLMLPWDQSASLFLGSPVTAKVEKIAANWVLEILDLPRESSVGFGTSDTACTLACIAAARRSILSRHSWNIDDDGLIGAPEVEVVISETAHITVKKALRILGFSMKRIHLVPADPFGRLDTAQLPPLNDRTILCLQAGEVHTESLTLSRRSSLLRERRPHGSTSMVVSLSGRVHSKLHRIQETHVSAQPCGTVEPHFESAYRPGGRTNSTLTSGSSLMKRVRNGR